MVRKGRGRSFRVLMASCGAARRSGSSPGRGFGGREAGLIPSRAVVRAAGRQLGRGRRPRTAPPRCGCCGPPPHRCEAAADEGSGIATGPSPSPAGPCGASFRPKTRCAPARDWPTWSAGSELSRGVTCRPIRHREERRVRAHLFLCLLAGYLEWHLRRAWAPLLFEGETLAEVRRTRDPVAPAKPADRALAQEGLPAHRRRHAPFHSLDNLIIELATRCRNTCRVPADPAAPPLSLLTEPTPTQRRAAHLIEIFPVPGTPKG